MHGFLRSILTHSRHTVSEVIDLKKEKSMPYLPNPMVSSFPGRSGSIFELLNRYGTYNIQPTADSDDLYPAIAQGLPRHLHNEKE